MWREPEDISIDDLPAVVILVQLVCLIVCQGVPRKVIAQYSHLCVCVCGGGVLSLIEHEEKEQQLPTRMRMTKPSSRQTNTTELMIDNQ